MLPIFSCRLLLIENRAAKEWVRRKSKIKFCGYLDRAEFKKQDYRWTVSTKHRTDFMSWDDFQNRKWKADHWNRRWPAMQAKMDYAENLCKLGMSTWAIEQITDLHPFIIDFLKRKLDGNVEVLRKAHYSNYVNHHPGQY